MLDDQDDGIQVDDDGAGNDVFEELVQPKTFYRKPRDGDTWDQEAADRIRQHSQAAQATRSQMQNEIDTLKRTVNELVLRSQYGPQHGQQYGSYTYPTLQGQFEWE